MKVTIKLKKVKGLDGVREISEFYKDLNEFVENYDIVEDVDMT